MPEAAAGRRKYEKWAHFCGIAATQRTIEKESLVSLGFVVRSVRFVGHKGGRRGSVAQGRGPTGRSGRRSKSGQRHPKLAQWRARARNQRTEETHANNKKNLTKEKEN